MIVYYIVFVKRFLNKFYFTGATGAGNFAFKICVVFFFCDFGEVNIW